MIQMSHLEAEHTTVSSSLHVDQLWVFVLITVYWGKTQNKPVSSDEGWDASAGFFDVDPGTKARVLLLLRYTLCQRIPFPSPIHPFCSASSHLHHSRSGGQAQTPGTRHMDRTQTPKERHMVFFFPWASEFMLLIKSVWLCQQLDGF